MIQDTKLLAPTNTQQTLCIFHMGEQFYALPVEVIIRIIPMVTIMPLLQTNDVVMGIINVQGELIPIVNLPHQLGLPESPLQLHTPILLIRYCNYTIGIIVDEVVDVLAIPVETVTRPEQILPEILQKETALAALANTSLGTIFILAMEHLFRPHQAEALMDVVESLAVKNEKEKKQPSKKKSPPHTSKRVPKLSDANILKKGRRS